MKMIVHSVLAMTVSMASPHQLLASEEMASEPVEQHPAAQMDVPPPPPGPYMSMALKEAPGFRGGRDMPTGDKMHSPFFKADMPWPEPHRMPRDWMPEEGYRFAPPSFSPEVRQPREPQPSAPAYYGYQQPWQPLPPPMSQPRWGGSPPPAPGYRDAPYGAPGYAPPAHPDQGPWMPLGEQRGW